MGPRKMQKAALVTREAAAIVRGTGARTYMHPLDIPIAESGGPFRPMTRHLVSWGEFCATCSAIPTSDWTRLPSTSL